MGGESMHRSIQRVLECTQILTHRHAFIGSGEYTWNHSSIKVDELQ
ncbi:hypothetical protein SHANETTE_223 [Bacillus phage Shanette]|uniref:Uncharacterized protein n=1 Tax=Bacillus phage Shanette TaxID=1296656 RepID=S5MBD4_9CAUD|nr:hypothetical protein AVV46_gp074 [Bacillus phage Shanette]AGR47109.1 hypothetical protein SHANETTE_223 [Bacillus phage Shanette]